MQALGLEHHEKGKKGHDTPDHKNWKGESAKWKGSKTFNDSDDDNRKGKGRTKSATKKGKGKGNDESDDDWKPR